MALQVSTANSVSSQYFDKTIIDNIFEDSVLFNKLKEKNKIKRGGGTWIQIPITYLRYGKQADNSTDGLSPLGGAGAGSATAGAVSPTGAITYAYQDTVTALKFYWKYYFASTIINWKERSENIGSEQIVNLLKHKSEELKSMFETFIYTDMYDVEYDTTDAGAASGGENTLNSTQICSINHMINVTDPLGVSGNDICYGGLLPTDVSTGLWTSIVDTHTTEMVLYPSDVTISGEHSLSERFNSACFGKDKPSLFITTRDLFTKYESLLSPQTRYEDVKTINAGFTNLTFKGIPIVADPKCPSGYFYGIDVDAIEWHVHKDWDYKLSDWSDKLESYPNHLVKTLSFAGNLISKRRRTHFKFMVLDATI